MGRFFGRLRDVVTTAPQEVLELFVSALALVWGLFLVNPYVNTFAVGVGWRAMAELAPEWAWGLGALLTGAAGILGLGNDLRRVRRYAAFLHAVAWAFISTMMVTSNALGTGWVTYGMVAAGSLIVFLRLGRRTHA